MTKKHCINQLNKILRQTLRSYHANSGKSQEELATLMQITPRAFSALENGAYGFSVFSMVSLLSILSVQERLHLLTSLCDVMIHWRKQLRDVS